MSGFVKILDRFPLIHLSIRRSLIWPEKVLCGFVHSYMITISRKKKVNCFYLDLQIYDCAFYSHFYSHFKSSSSMWNHANSSSVLTFLIPSLKNLSFVTQVNSESKMFDFSSSSLLWLNTFTFCCISLWHIHTFSFFF